MSHNSPILMNSPRIGAFTFILNGPPNAVVPTVSEHVSHLTHDHSFSLGVSFVVNDRHPNGQIDLSDDQPILLGSVFQLAYQLAVD